MAPVPRAQLTRVQQRADKEEARRKAAEDALLAAQDTISILEGRLVELGAVDARITASTAFAETSVVDVDQREHLHALVSDIEAKLKRRDELITSLTAQLESAQRVVKRTPESPYDVRQRVADLAAEVAHYKASTENLAHRVGRLEEQLRTLEAELKTERQKTEELRIQHSGTEAARNKAWVVVGDFDSLRRNSVLKGRALQRKTPDCSVCPECFRPVDILTATEFVVPAPRRRVKIWSTGHAAGSFKILSTGSRQTTVAITDQDSFWRYSKCLIIGY